MYPGKLGLFPERGSLAQRNFVYKNSTFIHFLMLERTSHEVNPFIENSQAEWEAFLDKRYSDLEALIEKEKQNA